MTLYDKRYEQQSKTTTFLKNDMREGSGPCRKQAILSPGTQNDGCESNQVIVSCNSAVVIICSVGLYPRGALQLPRERLPKAHTAICFQNLR